MASATPTTASKLDRTRSSRPSRRHCSSAIYLQFELKALVHLSELYLVLLLKLLQLAA
jgi:hypothetical protein